MTLPRTEVERIRGTLAAAEKRGEFPPTDADVVRDLADTALALDSALLAWKDNAAISNTRARIAEARIATLTEERDEWRNSMRGMVAEVGEDENLAMNPLSAREALRRGRTKTLTRIRELEEALRELTRCGATRTDSTLGRGWHVEQHAIDNARALLDREQKEEVK